MRVDALTEELKVEGGLLRVRAKARGAYQGCPQIYGGLVFASQANVKQFKGGSV